MLQGRTRFLTIARVPHTDRKMTDVEGIDLERRVAGPAGSNSEESIPCTAAQRHVESPARISFNVLGVAGSQSICSVNPGSEESEAPDGREGSGNHRGPEADAFSEA